MHSIVQESQHVTDRNARHPYSCGACLLASGLGFDFTMAFQPIIDITSRGVFAQEALVRGLNNEPAAFILNQVNDHNRYHFDQACRVQAVRLAAQLGIKSGISINFLPNAVYQPELCIRTTLEAAATFGVDPKQIIFEITEGEKVEDHGHLRDIVEVYKRYGFQTAIDDFGAGYSGLNLLAEFQPDLLKLDKVLIRSIEEDKGRQAIVKGVLQVCSELGITPIAEGVETLAEVKVLRAFGITLFQGFFFARPAFQAVAPLSFAALDSP